MKVLVACEFTGTVRDAFLAEGHDAMSVDLLPTESPGPHHQGDVLEVLTDGWDLMIAHPPCTYLALSGMRWLDGNMERWRLMEEAALFFRLLLNCPKAFIPKVAVENPALHGYALSKIGKRPTQYVQPWMFGHPEIKKTGLWLRDLPPLQPEEVVRNETMELPYAQRAVVHHAAPGPDRWKKRSATYPGIAAAMARQWGEAA